MAVFSLSWSKAPVWGLLRNESAGELDGDVALGQHQRDCDQAFDDARSRGDDPAPAEFVHQHFGNRGWVGGGERHRQQPGKEFAPMSRREHPEAERFA